ncbi:MAG: hypothetical protein NUV61_03235, partial [Candidatus Azambacteria bacterium]|nr:hypothetical protein [Candidatus Azambacteria bacterium]
ESITPAYRPTWQSPRYESDDTDVLPSVNRLREETPELSEDKKNDLEVAQRLQDTWAAWFDRFEHIPAAPPVIAAVAPEKPKNEPVETTIEIEPEVNIPIRTVYEPQQTIEEESQPNHLAVRSPSEEYEEREVQTSGNGRVMMAMQMFGVVFAMAIATIAVLGSGYVDSYILSNSQAQLIAGVAVYNK